MSRILINEMKIDFCINFIKLINLKITASVNNHGYLEYSALVTKEEAEKITKNQYDKEKIAVLFKNKVIFVGFPLEVGVSEVNQIYTLRVKSVSFTYLLQYTKYNYFYQDTTQTFADVLRESLKVESGSLLATKGNTAIKSPILQYLETPWNFSLRIAGKTGTVITPNITSDIPQLSLGIPNGSAYTVQKDEISKNRHLFENTKNTAKFRNIIESAYYTYAFEDAQVFALGDNVTVNSSSLSVVALTHELNNGIILNNYVLGSDEDLTPNKNHNFLQVGLNLQGSIIKVKGENVKVCLGIPDDAREGGNKATWFEYATESSNGMYGVPPKGTTVTLHWHGKRDGDVKAIHSIRGSTDFAENEYKSFTTEYRNGLSMTPRRVVFTSDSNILTFRKGISFNTSKKINIYAKKGIDMCSSQSINVKTPEEVTIAKSGIESSVTMSAREIDVKSSTSTLRSNSEQSIEKPLRKGIRKIIMKASDAENLDASTPKF